MQQLRAEALTSERRANPMRKCQMQMKRTYLELKYGSLQTNSIHDCWYWRLLRLRWPLALNFAEFGMKIFVNLEVA